MQICALTSMGPKCQRPWRSFFFSVAHFPGRSRLWFSIMGPGCQPHKMKKHWFLGFFFSPDFWLFDFNFHLYSLVNAEGRCSLLGPICQPHKTRSVWFLPLFLPLISGYSTLSIKPCRLVNDEGRCKRMGPGCQPHYAIFIWFIGLFSTPDFWWLDS